MTRARTTSYHEKELATLREQQTGDRDGYLTAESPLEGWLRPAAIRLEDGWLVREWFVDRDNDVMTKPGRTLLDGFRKLGRATDEQIRRFAELWGFLFDNEREPVALWRAWANAFNTTLYFAQELYASRRYPTDEQREALAEAHKSVGGTSIHGLDSWPSVAAARHRVDWEMLSRAVNWCLARGPVVTVFRFNRAKGDPEVKLRPQTLFGALALELASAAAADGIKFGKTCEICHRYFDAKTNKERFCGDDVCMKRAAANRKARSRERSASQSASQTSRTVVDMARPIKRKRPA